jgi:hypothetical protein
MLKVIQVHQLVVLASVVVACEGRLHATCDHVAILIRIGIALAQLIEIFKVTPFKLYNIRQTFFTFMNAGIYICTRLGTYVALPFAEIRFA